MSRIGNAPVSIPAEVEVSVSADNLVTVKGKKGELTQKVDAAITVKIEDSIITFARSSDDKDHRAKHGLYRSLVNNMIIGVTEGFKAVQELVGVGYRAEVKGQKLELALGYSHNVVLGFPTDLTVTAVTERGKPPIVTTESHDKQLVGQFAAKLRSLRKPEPYKGKGIRFAGEHIRRKAGKSAAK